MNSPANRSIPFSYLPKVLWEILENQLSPLSFDLAAHYSTFAGRQVTPILVVLRDLRKKSSCSILQFIEATANSDYQNSTQSI